MLRRLVALTLVTATALHAQIIGGPGPTSNFMPFGGFSNVGTPPATIYQQLFSAESWSAPVTFTGVRFFRASNAGAYRSGTYSVFLSTSSRTVQGSNTLSITDFDSNRGADNTLIGTLTLGGNAEATLTFTGGSFSYNPSMGNLLLDIRVAGGGANPADRVSMRAVASATNTLFSRAHNFSSTPMYNQGWGLVTEFLVGNQQVVPEPSTYALLATGLAISGALARRRRRAPH